ncbi:MAG: zf-HC2 domain-containing protein [Lachnospiraceae bacterium]|nr:zf-HC2 domain-containing protein [Lachnospiraceae bacterium]
MECKEAEKLIRKFIDDELDYRESIQFMEHVKECGNCKEELAIQFLVSEGMANLEQGGAFDLQGELDKRMEKVEKRIARNENLRYISYVIEFFAVVLIIIFIMLVFVK